MSALQNSSFPAEGNPGSKLVFNGVTIHDRDEMLSLTDMWRAQGGDKSRQPSEWLDSADGKRFCETAVEFLNPLKNIKPGDSGFEENQLVITKRGGKAPGTWAHWQIALAYAKYLSPEFHMQCNVVIRSYMEGRPARSPMQQALANHGASLPAVSAEQITRMFGMMRQMSHRSAEMSREIAVLKDQSREVAALKEQINAVAEVVTPSVPGAYVPGKRLVTILEEAGITDRPRGLINFLGKELAKAGIHHTGKDYMKVRLYPQEAVSEWLRKSGDKTLHRYIAEKRGQNALCLFNPNPVRKRGKNTCNDGVLLSSLFAEACCAVHELVKSGQVSAPGTPQHEYFMRAAFAAIVMASGISFPRAYSTPPALPAR